MRKHRFRPLTRVELLHLAEVIVALALLGVTFLTCPFAPNFHARTLSY